MVGHELALRVEQLHLDGAGDQLINFDHVVADGLPDISPFENEGIRSVFALRNVLHALISVDSVATAVLRLRIRLLGLLHGHFEEVGVLLLEPGYFLAYSCALLDEVVDEGLHLGLSELRRVSQVHQSFARVHVLGVVAEQAAALLDEGVVLEAKLEQFCD